MFAIIVSVVFFSSVFLTNVKAHCANESQAFATTLNWKDETPAGILKLLREGEKLIEFGEDRDLVLYMGLTGSGKSTTALYIAGYDDELVSRETRPRSKEYLIDDRCRQISRRSMQSQTLIPRGIVDRQTKTKYFDMPGFSDTRSVAFDIASTYFTKLVLNHAQRVKLIFVVSHSHVMAGIDRVQFKTLVDHVTRLMPNISKYEDSIALIATKVANQYDPSSPPDTPYVPDDVVIEGIVDFLKDARSFLATKNNDEGVRLVNTLLLKKGDSFARIGIFRRPDAAGPINKVVLLQKNKLSLKTMIDENLRFSQKNDSDFGYSLSAESRVTLLEMANELPKNMSDSIALLGRQIETRMDELNDPQVDFEELLLTVKNASNIDETQFQNMENFTNYLEKYSREFGVNILDSDLRALREGEKHLTFIAEMNEKPPVDPRPIIQSGMKATLEYLQNLWLWYDSLSSLLSQLSSYPAQKWRFENYNISHLLNEIGRFDIDGTVMAMRLGALEEINIDKNIIRTLEKQKHVTSRQVRILKKILFTTLASPVNSTCEDYRLTLRGNFILLSQVLHKLHSCPIPVMYLEILALEKIFIDTDLNLVEDNIRQLSMIAPTWETTGRYAITLDGKTGRSHREQKAASGTPGDRNGAHGMPGLPGGSAGHFVGIGAEFIGAENLTVSAMGGAGGNGQDGGDGYVGADGEEAPRFDGYYRIVDNVWRRYWIERKTPGFSFIPPIYTDEYLYIHGNPPPGGIRSGDGAPGGNGGCGGRSGFPGEVTIIDLSPFDGNSSLKITRRRGFKQAERDGKGGTGGRHGRVPRLLVEENGWILLVKSIKFVRYTEDPYYEVHDGMNGADGMNAVGLQEPEMPISSDISSFIAINDYVLYVWENLDSNLCTKKLKTFLSDIANDTMVANLYTSFGKVVQR